VRAAARRGQHEREKKALRDLDPFLLGQRPGSFGRDGGAGGRQAREPLRGRVDELLVADRPAQVVRQRVVDGVDVGAEELRAGGVESRPQRGGRRLLGLVPIGARGKTAEKLLTAREMRRGRGGSLVEGGCRAGGARAPGVDLSRGKARRLNEGVGIRHPRA